MFKIFLTCSRISANVRDPHTMKMVVLVHFLTAYLVRRRVKTRLRISADARSSHHEDGDIGASMSAFDPHTMKMVVLVRRCGSSSSFKQQKKREQGPTALSIHRSR